MAKRIKEATAIKSIAMKKSWARRKKAQKERLKVFKDSNAIHNARTIPVDEGRAEWKEADPIEVQLKDAHATIERLRRRISKYESFREIVTSLRTSMNGMINIVNSTNNILEHD